MQPLLEVGVDLFRAFVLASLPEEVLKFAVVLWLVPVQTHLPAHERMRSRRSSSYVSLENKRQDLAED